jgi:quercetin dioxygenase-like cupin family protein/DNA-binding XRE family transcriptional regulator
MEPDVQEVANRIRSLREDLGLGIEAMAASTGRSVKEYIAQEKGEKDLSFTFLYKCAAVFGVDVVELLTGEAPHLKGYELVRGGEGLSLKRREGFEYLHQAPFFSHKLCEPFIVTAPYVPAEQDAPIHLSYHRGQELDYVISGRLRFAFEDHVEELGPGDTLYYDSGRGHGMIAIGGAPCVFLAVVLKPQEEGPEASDAKAQEPQKAPDIPAGGGTINIL